MPNHLCCAPGIVVSILGHRLTAILVRISLQSLWLSCNVFPPNSQPTQQGWPPLVLYCLVLYFLFFYWHRRCTPTVMPWHSHGFPTACWLLLPVLRSPLGCQATHHKGFRCVCAYQNQYQRWETFSRLGPKPSCTGHTWRGVAHRSVTWPLCHATK